MAIQANSSAFARVTDNPNLNGLSKREYFAVRMAAAIVTSGETGTTTVSDRAVKYADALLDSLNSPKATDQSGVGPEAGLFEVVDEDKKK